MTDISTPIFQEMAIFHGGPIASEVAQRLTDGKSPTASLSQLASQEQLTELINDTSKVSVFIIETAEDEAPAAEASAFAKLLIKRAKAGEACLGEYVCIGAGDSSISAENMAYLSNQRPPEDCNPVARSVDMALTKIGKTRKYPMLYLDVARDWEKALDVWRKKHLGI
ncbi:hypothetical protein CYMTET_54429 [Cymbomonas tetramitiformis]|uniref:Uncharacterized protein n=1 Tax=Cymbomonas tetramitiformis TaxID=36881 RepID=A0AAE0BGQ9_9CHLO|nr:hypothetical protein CYMTET_54429 [Cymbomonas tetramitiformis]|eukprot:gene11268-13315_t